MQYLGAKNGQIGASTTGNGGTDMFNATLSSGSGITKLLLNGDSTVFWRAAIQESLADGPGSQGQFFHDGPHSQARIHTLICSGSTDINEITTDKELVKIVDQLGRETKGRSNSPLFYIYNDGTSEKKNNYRLIISLILILLFQQYLKYQTFQKIQILLVLQKLYYNYLEVLISFLLEEFYTHHSNKQE